VAALGWLLDCFDQQLFVLARQPAMRDLLPGSPSSATIDQYGGYATAIFLMGWGIGGLIFGVMGDRIGRAKTMMFTILMYSVFTGLSAISVSFWDFALYRFLTGMGVGGEFAVGVALVAEVMPDRARPYTLGLLQALSAVGNISAALVGMWMGHLVATGQIESVWRPMFVIGAVPAVLALVVRWRLREPERWEQASHEGDVARKLGSYRELFGHPLWRRHALIGLGLAFSGIVGLWGVGFFTFDLVGNVLRDRFVAETIADRPSEEMATALAQVFPREEAERLSEQPPLEIARALSRAEQKFARSSEGSQQQTSVLKEVLGEDLETVTANVTHWKSIASMMMNLGAALGMYGFAIVTFRMGRKPTFAICFVAALISTAAVFGFLNEFHQVFWMIPVMGVCILSLFAGYAIYFPELFPTHLRSTGTSFCYNVGRFVAAIGPALLGWLTGEVYADTAAPLRYAGLTMCGIFVLGLLVLPFAPETKGKPLPE
jgi:MFS family permease